MTPEDYIAFLELEKTLKRSINTRAKKIAKILSKRKTIKKHLDKLFLMGNSSYIDFISEDTNIIAYHYNEVGVEIDFEIDNYQNSISIPIEAFTCDDFKTYSRNLEDRIKKYNEKMEKNINKD